MPKRDPSDKSLLPEVITSALRARLRGLADVRAAREGSVAGYRVLSGAGFAQLAASKGIAGYRVTRGYVVAWCNGAAEGAGWYSNRDAAQMGFDFVRRQVSAGTTAELEHQQRIAGEVASTPPVAGGLWDRAS